MNTHSSPRRGFTLTELCVLLAIIGLASAQGIPLIQEAREKARRTQCSNNLRVLGIAVHNYADQNSEQMVPASSNFAHWSWAYFLLPYMEGAATFDSIRYDRWAADPRDTGFMGGTHAEVVAKFRAPGLMCPTRRTAALVDAWWNEGMAQPTDYAAVLAGSSPRFSGNDATGCIIWRAQPADFDNRQVLRSSTTFGSCIDGLSYTAIIGEKHMKPEWINDPLYEQAALVGGSGGYLRLFHGRVLGGNTVFGSTRSPDFGLNRGLASYPNQDPGNAAGAKPLAIVDEWSFGGWHPDVCLFLMGDATVHPIKSDTDTRILSLLGGRNDRQPFEMPAESSE